MSKNRTWERWDDPGVAEVIDRYWSTDPSGYETILRSILARLVQRYLVSSTETVLEVGCGSGLIYEALVPKIIVNSAYVGADTSLKMLEIARKRYPTGQFIHGDIYQLQFPSNSFDVTLCFEVLGHLPEIQKPIAELFRVAARLVILTVWSSPEDKTLTSTEQVLDSKFLHQLYSPDDIFKAIRQAANNEPHSIEVRVLSDRTWAYLIFKRQETHKIQVSRRPARIFSFHGLTDLFIHQQVNFKNELDRIRQEYANIKEALNESQLKLSEDETELEEVRTILKNRDAEVSEVHQALTTYQQELQRMEGLLTSTKIELGQVKEDWERRGTELEEAHGTLRSRETQLEEAHGALRSRETQLEEARGTSRSRETQLQEARGTLRSRETQLEEARSTLRSRETQLEQLQQDFSKVKETLNNFQDQLKDRETELDKVRSALGSRETELEETRAALQSRETQLEKVRNKARIITHELDMFRHRKVTRWVNRILARSNAWQEISPPFHQLKDDSLIFSRGLRGYRLQPSVNLQRIPFVHYPLDLSRPNLAGILLAPIIDLPLKNGVIGIEIVSPSNTIVTQKVVPASQIDESVPTRFDFSPIRDSDQRGFWLRVFSRGVDAPVRIFEWRKFSALGLGPLKTKAFCGFLFQNTL